MYSKSEILDSKRLKFDSSLQMKWESLNKVNDIDIHIVCWWWFVIMRTYILNMYIVHTMPLKIENFQRNEFARYVNCLITYGKVLPNISSPKKKQLCLTCEKVKNCYRLFDVQTNGNDKLDSWPLSDFFRA